MSELGKQEAVYQKCIGIARCVNGFKCTLQGSQIILTGNGIQRNIPTEMFFKLDANEIIELLENRNER